MNIIPIFPILISKSSIPYDWGRENILKFLDLYFEKQLQTGEVDRSLHKRSEFQTIVQYMNETVKEYWKALNYSEVFPIELNQMWANCYLKNDRFPHNLDVDGPANVTVVFYIQKESADMGNLFFGNPTELIWQTQPLTEERRHEQRYHEIDGRTGDLVCFPSWLQHGIHPNNTDIPRISIAGNYELRGLATIRKALSIK
jgi:uncharacterized protein (TIGR02466 family)